LQPAAATEANGPLGDLSAGGRVEAHEMEQPI